MHQRKFHGFKIRSASGNDDRRRFAPTHGDGNVLDTNRDRIAPDDAFVQHLDPCALDEAEFDQAALEFSVRQRRARAASVQALNHAGIATTGESHRHLRPLIAMFGPALYFQSQSGRSSPADTTRLYLRAIINTL